MKIAVTGGAGFIGSHLVNYLTMRGHEVIAIDLYPHKPAWLHSASGYQCQNIQSLQEWSFNSFAAEAVFHLSAVSRVVTSFENPRFTYSTNVIGTLKVAEACKAANIPLIYAGSCTALNPQKVDDCSDSPYAQSKRMGEEIVLSEYLDLDARVVRLFNVYGKILSGKEHSTDSVVSVFGRNVSRGEDIKVVDDGNQNRDFIHVSDVVEALYAALFDKSRKVFEAGTGISTSIKDLAVTMSQMKVDVVFGSKRRGERVGYTAIPQKYPGGLTPKISLHEYIEQFHITGEL